MILLLTLILANPCEPARVSQVANLEVDDSTFDTARVFVCRDDFFADDIFRDSFE